MQNLLSSCIEWTREIRANGYGRAKIKGKNWSVHRYAWTVVNGPIPEGLFVCHKCDNRKCYNVEHLFLGTAKDNIQDCHNKGRSRQAKTTHCPRGHEYDVANTRIATRNGRTYRKCRACHREWERVRNAKRNRV